MCIFALSRTTIAFEKGDIVELWIASKCVSLHYHVQPSPFRSLSKSCCELLQNVYLCIITYNSIFVAIFTSELWIASKCVSLHYHVQLFAGISKANFSCELLQNVYLCIITYNSARYVPKYLLVVNCFKMCIFALSRTTTIFIKQNITLLWIASKCVSLHYHVQH